MAAAFDENDLVAVVYNENDNEVAIILGDSDDMDFTASNQELAASSSVNLTQFGKSIEWGDLSLAFFSGTQTGGTVSDWETWFATTKETISGISTSALTNFQSGVASVYSYWGDGDTFNDTASATNSYDMKLNSGSNDPGSYTGAYNTETTYGEASLAEIDGVDGYVDMYLYHYVWADLDKGSDDATDYTAILRLYTDGSVVLNSITLTPVGDEYIDLNIGWNLISLSVQPSITDISTVLDSISGKYISVWAYENNTWKVYDPENPAFSDLETIKPGYGYWINARQECTWTLP